MSYNHNNSIEGSNRELRHNCLPKKDFPKVSNKISMQKQNRHLKDRKEYERGGYFDNIKDANECLV